MSKEIKKSLFWGNMRKITAKTTFKKILESPKSEEVLAKYSVPCLSCPMAIFEIEKLKIGDVCKMYGIDAKGLLKELNKKNE